MIRTLFRKMVDSFEIEWKKGGEIQEYQIIECIGKGSYGTAYKVRYKKKGKEAVLKRIRPYKKLFSDHIRYMDNETMILRKLHHPHFPEVYASGCHKGTPYFIMEKMRGKTFEDLIFAEGKSYSEEESLEIGIKLVNLIIDIHRKGYVHRDLRIPNILWDNGVINIIDFGLACKIEEESEKEPLNHKDYMREKTARSDLYALGHFLLFLLYSSYDPIERKEKSWEEELDIRPETSVLIQKLLRIQQPFKNAEEAHDELMKIRYEKNS